VIVRSVSHAWAWTRCHPLAADVALAVVLFGAALVSAKVELENVQA
jgi:hypothetical protein